MATYTGNPPTGNTGVGTDGPIRMGVDFKVTQPGVYFKGGRVYWDPPLTTDAPSLALYRTDSPTATSGTLLIEAPPHEPYPPKNPLGDPWAVSSAPVGGQYGGGSAIDGSTATRWLSNPPTAAKPEWFEITLADPAVLTSYSIHPYQSVYNPRTWTFQGWDGTAWVTLDTRTDYAFPSIAEYSFAFTNTVAYQKYRWHFTANNGNTQYMAISELKWFTASGTKPPLVPPTAHTWYPTPEREPYLLEPGVNYRAVFNFPRVRPAEPGPFPDGDLVNGPLTVFGRTSSLNHSFAYGSPPGFTASAVGNNYQIDVVVTDDPPTAGNIVDVASSALVQSTTKFVSGIRRAAASATAQASQTTSKAAARRSFVARIAPTSIATVSAAGRVSVSSQAISHTTVTATLQAVQRGTVVDATAVVLAQSLTSGAARTLSAVSGTSGAQSSVAVSPRTITGASSSTRVESSASFSARVLFRTAFSAVADSGTEFLARLRSVVAGSATSHSSTFFGAARGFLDASSTVQAQSVAQSSAAVRRSATGASSSASTSEFDPRFLLVAGSAVATDAVTDAVARVRVKGSSSAEAISGITSSLVVVGEGRVLLLTSETAIFSTVVANLRARRAPLAEVLVLSQVLARARLLTDVSQHRDIDFSLSDPRSHPLVTLLPYLGALLAAPRQHPIRVEQLPSEITFEAVPSQRPMAAHPRR